MEKVFMPYRVFKEDMAMCITLGIVYRSIVKVIFHHNGVEVIGQESWASKNRRIPDWCATGIVVEFIPSPLQAKGKTDWPDDAFGDDFLDRYRDIISYAHPDPLTRTSLDF